MKENVPCVHGGVAALFILSNIFGVSLPQQASIPSLTSGGMQWDLQSWKNTGESERRDGQTLTEEGEKLKGV